MANNRNAIGQFREEVTETAGEVVEDVKDQVGQALEQAAQAVTGTQLTPQQPQPFDSAQGRQKQTEDQKKELDRQKQLAYTRRWIGDLQIAQEKVRAENKQKEQQRLQAQKQEEQEEKVIEAQGKQALKKPGGTTQDAILRSQAEYKPGKGVGG